MGFTRRHDQPSPVGPGGGADDDGDDDDSDIEEIAIVMPGEGRPQPVLKRRKSSPQMDPIPSYTPTPLHILEQRARGEQHTLAHSPEGTHANYGDAPYPTYNPSPIRTASHSSPSETRNSSTQARSHHRHNDDDYVPLLHPSPHVISCGKDTAPISHYFQPPSSHETASRTSTKRPAPQQRPGSTSSSTPRPVSSALAQAVNRRRNSLAQQQEKAATLVTKEEAVKSVSAYFHKAPVSSEYAEKPVMWSPKTPSELERVQMDKEKQSEKNEQDPISVEDYSKLQSVRPVKQRIAHKPTVPKNNRNRPKVPLGNTQKVPLALRAKYLNVIIDEYLNTGHKEEESYECGLKEEKTLADRAASKSIYVNLVAGLKKKIREKAGISTLPPNEDAKFVNGNKVVSHEEILTGKVKGTFSIERKRKLSDPSDLNEQELYDRLSRYLLPHDQLAAYNYPYRDPENPDLRMAPLGKDGQRQQLRAELATSYICERCSKLYRVGEDGLPLTANKCIFHPGHLWNERINKSLEKRYSCCKGDPSAGGCSSNLFHVHKGELELENYTGYQETQAKPERDPNKHGIYALDCEMSYTTFGLELTRVTVINYKEEVVYERLVKPKNPILDYNTKYSGIKPGDLDNVTTTLADVQRDLLRMFSSRTFLVGHSLDSDMRALKIFHTKFIDTAQLFPHKRGLPFKRALRTLMVENLRVIIQEDAGHDSKEDACAAFRLVMWKAKTDVPVKAT